MRSLKKSKSYALKLPKPRKNCYSTKEKKGGCSWIKQNSINKTARMPSITTFSTKSKNKSITPPFKKSRIRKHNKVNLIWYNTHLNLTLEKRQFNKLLKNKVRKILLNKFKKMKIISIWMINYLEYTNFEKNFRKDCRVKNDDLFN